MIDPITNINEYNSLSIMCGSIRPFKINYILMKIYRLVFSPIEVNTYVIADQSGDCAIIDCGCYGRNEFNRFEMFLHEKKLKPVLLLNTHCHLDHVFGNGFILEKYKLRTLCSKEDEYNRTGSVQHAMIFGMTMELPPEPEGYLNDGQMISFGDISFTALLVPGHSTGSLAFYCKNENVVFTGDALFAGSIGRSDLEGGNHRILVSSIKNKLFTLPDETIVYPGHGQSTTIKTERETNPYFINS
jgi:glyoxylase-like metal-dependent hydrolase (beta-lactamase superfamily II)